MRMEQKFQKVRQLNLLLFNQIKLAVITEISFLIQFSKLHAMSQNHNLNHSQNQQLELDLEKLAKDSMNSPVSRSLNVKTASSANQEEVSVFQALKISVKNLENVCPLGEKCYVK